MVQLLIRGRVSVPGTVLLRLLREFFLLEPTPAQGEKIKNTSKITSTGNTCIYKYRYR